MTNRSQEGDRQVNALISGAGLATSVLLAAFALTATPVVAEFAKRFNFQIASHSAAIFRWPTWPVLVIAALATGAFIAKDRLLVSPRRRLVVGLLLAVLMVSVLSAYVFSVLTPIAQLEQHMQSLDRAAAASNG
jgi:hypothetical protein